MEFTIANIFAHMPADNTYMVCPKTERTMELLKQQYISAEEDKELDEISDAYEKIYPDKTKDPGPLVVSEFGYMIVEKTINYEESTDVYLLFLVE